MISILFVRAVSLSIVVSGALFAAASVPSEPMVKWTIPIFSKDKKECGAISFLGRPTIHGEEYLQGLLNIWIYLKNRFPKTTLYLMYEACDELFLLKDKEDLRGFYHAHKGKGVICGFMVGRLSYKMPAFSPGASTPLKKILHDTL